jgi:hypothetical protein
VTIRWQEYAKPEEITVPGFLDLVDRRDLVAPRSGKRARQVWHAALTGSVVELIRWSAAQPVEDLSIGQPDLATLFQQYYV